MALIYTEQFNWIKKNRNSAHKPTVVTFTVFEYNEQKYFQIDTYGTDERVIQEKMRQSIQLDESIAETLVDISKREFSLK